MERLSENISENICRLDQALMRDTAVQIKMTAFEAGLRKCAYYYLDGIADSYRLVLMQYAFQTQENTEEETVEDFAKKRLAANDYRTEQDLTMLAKAVLKGDVVLLADGFDTAFILDLKRPPTRGIQEPDKSKTLRGPHEGFCENLILNLALIRRRVRSADLQYKQYELGEATQTDVAMLYMSGKADDKTVRQLDRRLSSIHLKALSMAQETVAEQLFPGIIKRLNPFPKVRFTERPDTAAAMLLEGKILILCDNSPSAIVLPVSLFDFFEETDDYYFPIPTGTYMRLVRFFVFLATVYLAPFWLLATKNTDILPSLFQFVGKIEGEYTLPIFLQLLIIEFAIDGLRLASLNTPSSLSNSLSIVGGLLLGDYAVKSGWFVPQTILYSAFTAMANFVPSNLELGYSFKFQRMSLILLTEFFGLWGLIGGSVFFFVLLAFTKSVDGKNYLYPLIPFDGKALLKIFIRTGSGREEE